MDTPETRLHARLLPFFVGILVLGVSYFSPLLAPWDYPEQLESAVVRSKGIWAIVALGATMLASPLLYKALARFMVDFSRRHPRVLRAILKEVHVGGFWIGTISGPGGTSLAIEHYKQSLTSLKVVGEAVWPDGSLTARWESTAAFIDPEGPYIRVIFRTTVYDDCGNVLRKTGGFGKLRLEAEDIEGEVVDKPELIERNGQSLWTPKTFHYQLRRLNSEINSFQAARATKEWKELFQTDLRQFQPISET